VLHVSEAAQRRERLVVELGGGEDARPRPERPGGLTRS